MGSSPDRARRLTARAATGAAAPVREQPDERVERILAVLHSVGAGEVVTYGDVADDAGYPKHARLVGRVLATTDAEVPWWRVVNAAGRLVPGNEREQSALLRGEGVEVRDGKVRRARHGRFARPN